jgi:hypothetical protein
MNYTHPSFILCVIALILSVAAFIWPIPWQVVGILLAIAAVIPRG